MENKQIRIPGSDHPITIEQNTNRVIIKIEENVIADTYNALILREANYPPVQYIPREDVNMALLQPSTHKTFCPYKGNCSYYNVAIDDKKIENAAWSYENPHNAVERIRGYIAFYPERVDSINETQFA